jgi:hypothetical protein
MHAPLFERCRRAAPYLVLAALAGCTSNKQFLSTNQQAAEQTALERGRFELNCPEATSTILSREVVEPVVMGPRMIGVARAEYTIGVSGCGKRATFVVVCPEGGDGCFAAGPGSFIR